MLVRNSLTLAEKQQLELAKTNNDLLKSQNLVLSSVTNLATKVEAIASLPDMLTAEGAQGDGRHRSVTKSLQDLFHCAQSLEARLDTQASSMAAIDCKTRQLVHMNETNWSLSRKCWSICFALLTRTSNGISSITMKIHEVGGNVQSLVVL